MDEPVYRSIPLETPEGTVGWVGTVLWDERYADECLRLRNLWFEELRKLGLHPFGQWNLSDDNLDHLPAIAAFIDYEQIRKLAEGELQDVPVPEGWEGPRPEKEIQTPEDFLAWLNDQRIVLSQLAGCATMFDVDHESPLPGGEPTTMRITITSIGRTLRNSWRMLREVYQQQFEGSTKEQIDIIGQSLGVGIGQNITTWAMELKRVEQLIAYIKIQMAK